MVIGFQIKYLNTQNNDALINVLGNAQPYQVRLV